MRRDLEESADGWRDRLKLQFRLTELCQRSFLDFAVADAGRTHSYAFPGTFDESVNALQVQIPAALAHVMGMTDAMPELRPAATDFTNFCHKNTLTLGLRLSG